MESPGLLLLIAAVALLLLTLTRAGRVVLMVAVLIIVLMAAKTVFVREVACPRTGSACFMPVQRVNYGPCWASEGTALLRLNGTYYLTARAGANATATCVSLAVWR